ncbi:hypothetical protein, partial [Amycolatopsis japonica]
MGKIEYDDGGFPQLRLLDDGEGWIDRETTGEENPGTYVQWAPAQAPRLRLDEPIHLGPQIDTSDGPDDVVGWRPPADKTQPQTLKALLVHRGLARWLRDGTLKDVVLSDDVADLLNKPPLSRLPGELQDMVLQQVALDPAPEEWLLKWLQGIKKELAWEYRYELDAVARMADGLVDHLVAPAVPEDVVKWRRVAGVGAQTLREYLLRREIERWLSAGKLQESSLDEEDKRLLAGTRLEQIPLERLEKLQRQAGLEPAPRDYVDAWLEDIIEQRRNGVFRYSPDAVARMSGGLVDAWLVRDLRGIARANWQGRLLGNGTMPVLDRTTVGSMLKGFVDAAVLAEPNALPNVQGVFYVAEGDPDPGAAAREARRVAKETVTSRLAEYPPDEVDVSAQTLQAQVDVRTRVVPVGDPRVGVLRFHVDKQRTPGGFYGPEVRRKADDPPRGLGKHLRETREALAKLDRDDPVFALARDMVNQFNLDPEEFTGPASPLQDLYKARYEAAVDMVADDLLRGGDARATAAVMADWVGLRRRHGAVAIPEAVSEQDVSVWSDLELGGLVQVRDGVGRIRAGAVLGDADSLPGQAALWLQREPGVFGVVFTGHIAPDVETVVKALHDAGWNGKDSLRLFLGLPALAGQLGERFKVVVSYPEAEVWFGMARDHAAGRPAVRVRKIENAEDLKRPSLLKNGMGWIDREPGRAEKPGTYVLAASVEAPRLGLDRIIHLGPRTDTVPVAEDVAGWRPAQDGTGPRDLKKFLLRRGLARWLKDGKLAGVVLSDDAAKLFDGPLLGRLPVELWETVLQQVALDPTAVPQVEAWFARIRDEIDRWDEIRYSPEEVAKMSGGQVDAWVVGELRWAARADWHGRLINDREQWIFDVNGLPITSTTLTRLGRTFISAMLRGFVDAAVQASPGALPSVLGVLYLAEGDPVSEFLATLRSLTGRVLKYRLASYPNDVAPRNLAEVLPARVDFWIRMVPPGDPRIDTARFHVDGQRALGGLYGPGAYNSADDPPLVRHTELQRVRTELAGLDRETADEVFKWADKLVNEYNEKPVDLTEPTSQVNRLHRARYDTAVQLVAWRLHYDPAGTHERTEERARFQALSLADWVGLRKRRGVVGDVSERHVRPRPVSDSGGLVPVSARVGIVRAGVVLGDLSSPAGRAARWLPPEPGVFGVVITDRHVPDVETVAKALYDAGWNGKDALRLFLCAQPGLQQLAAQLEARFHVRVSYPRYQVWFGMPTSQWGVRPAARVGRIINVDGYPRLRLMNDGGGWIDREPGGGKKKGTYVLTAPAQAPRLGLDQLIHLGPRTGTSPVSEKVVKWRPPADRSKPQTLRDFVLKRGIANKLQLGRFARRRLGKGAKILLHDTPLGTELPLELLEMVREQVELDPVSQADVEAWFAGIKDEMSPDGEYLYSVDELVAMSGGLADAWVVKELREIARAHWHGQLIDFGRLTNFGSDVVADMLRGFVDAVVGAQVRSGALPRVQGVLYVAQGDDTSVSEVRSFAERTMETWLLNYRPGLVSVQSLLARVDIRTRELPPDDARIGTAWLHVEGQRPPGGLYGWVAHTSVAGQRLEERLRQAGVTLVDEDFRRAREVVNKYNEGPARFAGEDPQLQRLHQARYEDLVASVAVILHRNSQNVALAESLADQRASADASSVGPRPRHGVLGGVSVPVSGLGVRSGSVVEPGWLVPAGDGVGVVEAGMVLGDVGSRVGLAGAWLQRERGVFGVVVPGRRVPDVETVARALDRAGWNKRDKVRLFLCYQPGLEKLAQDLADRYGVDVFYPKEKLWFGVAGGAGYPAARVEKLEYVDCRPRLTLLEDGTGWAGRKPGGGEEEEGAAYVLTAPARAPRLGLRQKVHLGPRIDTSPVSERVVNWRRPADESKPQTLKEFLVRRGVAYGLVDGWLSRLDGAGVRRGVPLGADVANLLGQQPLSKLPPELWEMVLREVALEPASVSQVEAWLDKIKYEAYPDGGYRYDPDDVARLSGGLVDVRAVEELRAARAHWQGRLDEYGMLEFSDSNEVVAAMVVGFVDAAVRAPSGELPSVHGVFYVAEGDPYPEEGADAETVQAMATVESRLGEYPSGVVGVSAEALGDQVHIRTEVVPAGDPRIGTAQFDVFGQRPPGGLFGPEVYWNVDDPDWALYSALQEVRVALAGLGSEEADAVFEKARRVVNRYNLEPGEVSGPSLLRDLYEARYEAVAALVAAAFLRFSGNSALAETHAARVAARQADMVGPRRWRGVVGVGPVPVSEGDVRAWSAVKLGHLVPVADGVGRIRAGMVLGDLDSPAG